MTEKTVSVKPNFINYDGFSAHNGITTVLMKCV